MTFCESQLFDSELANPKKQDGAIDVMAWAYRGSFPSDLPAPKAAFVSKVESKMGWQQCRLFAIWILEIATTATVEQSWRQSLAILRSRMQSCFSRDRPTCHGAGKVSPSAGRRF